MNARCELDINGRNRRILLVAKEEERVDHIALRLSAAALFFDEDPALEVGPKHPALDGIEFFPDLLTLDKAGGVAAWIECGNTAMNKLIKVARKLRSGRIVVIRESPEDGLRLREALKKEAAREERIEIWCWPKDEFARWTAAIAESSHVVGEARGRSINLVLNAAAFSVDLTSC